MAWRHTVYLGVYQQRDIYEALDRLFPTDDDAEDDHGKEESACAAILVDQQGCYLEDTAVLSSAAWGVGRAHRPGPGAAGWLSGFYAAAADFEDRVDALQGQRARAVDADDAPPLDAAAVVSIRDLAIAAAGVDCEQAMADGAIRISSKQVHAGTSDDPPPTTDFLNSPFLVDLHRVANAVEGGDVGSALATYLRADALIDENQRVDVRGTIGEERVVERTGVDQMPVGRWPSDPTQPLALSQQFAVNEAFAMLGPGAGLMGVNGPPGTGKTTMLRDLVACLVVERASRLATLSHPGKAFNGRPLTWSSQSYARRLRCLRPEFTGFEIVVASSNNSAVENISNELPAKSAIHEHWQDRADYFGTVATRTMHAADHTKRDAGDQAWGLIAARLGNVDNRRAFLEAFWWDTADPESSMQSTLKGPPRQPTWQQARQAFTAANNRVRHLLAERRDAASRITALADLTKAINERPATINAARAAVDHLDTQIAARTSHLRALYDHYRASEADCQRHLDAQPSRWKKLSSFGKATADWRKTRDELSALFNTKTAIYSQAYHHHQDLLQVRAAAAGELSRLLADEPHLQQRRWTELRQQVADDENRYGRAHPGPRWREIPERLHVHAPWLDVPLNEARSELFLAAMDLHKAFITHGDILEDLQAVIEVVRGRAPKDLSPKKVRAAWQLFFLVVPVVSTAFASTGRMFARLPRESIGWLLIDEAGQASPQAAVGAIWRARRVVAVGDPQQIRPVVTIPRRAQDAIATTFDISPTWRPRDTSVQQLADRTATWGTELASGTAPASGERPKWVSAPLRVHRRCDDPMFTLCNEIAYDNFMIQDTRRKPDPSDRFDGLPPSRWIDVRATAPGTHLQRKDIEKFRDCVNDLLQRGLGPTNIIAISPFRTMADELKLTAEKEFPGMRAGTVHTAQGREAPVVFLVLGGDPAKRGAREGFARTPNLVNVAASRAQRRLYVIGDHQRWAQHSHFKELAAALNIS